MTGLRLGNGATGKGATRDGATRDPATNDPAARDHAMRDPAMRDPATRDPATRDPAENEPATDDPAGVGTRARTSNVVDLAPVALVVLAEAAWISVLAGLLLAWILRPPVLGLPALAGFVAIGILSARLIGPRLGERWPVFALGLVVLAAIAGWLASGPARAALGEGLGPSLAAHPAGWLAGLAVLRGFAHSRLRLMEDTVGHLLSIGVLALAILAIAGGTAVEPYRTTFLADTLAAAVVFVVAATLAAALARLTAIGAESGFDWRRNPAWLGLVLAILAVAIAAALSVSAVGASTIQTVMGAAIVALMIVTLVAAFDRTAVRLVLSLIAIEVVVYLLVAGIGEGSRPIRLPGAGSGPGSDDPSTVIVEVMTLGFGGLVLLAAIVGIVVLAAIWMRRTPPPDEDPVEESRTIDRRREDAHPREGHRRFGRRPEPADAAGAYVALVAYLASHPNVRRDPAETPAEHADRLRAHGRSGLSLNLLAADYALARYGGVTLSAREDRRAIARWRALRRRIPSRRG